MEPLPFTNTGVIPEVRKTDFFASGETPLSPNVIITDGQWDKYLPDEESQSIITKTNMLFDTSACVSFSACNAVETVLNAQYALGMLTDEQKAFLVDNGYIDRLTGKINLSDRFTAKMSGTTTRGNSLPAVGDSIRKHGVVPERLWALLEHEMSNAKTATDMWNIYYADIPDTVKKIGEKFVSLFDVTYQWVLIAQTNSSWQSIKERLPYGPIQIAANICSPWNANESNPPIPSCGCGTGHGTIVYGQTDVAFKDFDHYKSFRKLLAKDYCIPYGIQFYVGAKVNSTTDELKGYSFTKRLMRGDTGDDVHKLQTFLQTVKRPNGNTYMKQGNYGPYGPATSVSVLSWQLDRKLDDPLTLAKLQGSYFGPRSILQANKELLALQ